MMKFGSMNAVWSIHSEYWIHNLVSFAAKLFGLSVNFWAAHTKKKKKRKNKQRPKGIPSCKNFLTVALEYLHDRCQPVIKQLKSVYKKQATTTATTTRTKGNEVAKKIYLCKCSDGFCFWASETSEKCVACLC